MRMEGRRGRKREAPTHLAEFFRDGGKGGIPPLKAALPPLRWIMINDTFSSYLQAYNTMVG